MRNISFAFRDWGDYITFQSQVLFVSFSGRCFTLEIEFLPRETPFYNTVVKMDLLGEFGTCHISISTR